jgi:hypothetical protein
MAESYKVLAQHLISTANTFQNVYTVSNNTSVALSSIHFLNTSSANNISYKLGVVKAEDAATSGVDVPQYLIGLSSLNPLEASEIVGGITLSAGDQLRVLSNETSLAVHVYGVEFA